MGSKTQQALRRAVKATAAAERGTGQDPIVTRLRALQAERQRESPDVTDIVEALVPAAAAACTAGHLVSLSKMRGSSTVLFRIRDGEQWLDWYCAEADFAGQVAEELVRAFSGD